MAPPEHYFILIYDVETRKLEHEAFETSVAEATDRYSVLEEQHRDHGNIEVVLVGADSLDTIKKTHSHYFIETADDLFEQFLQGTHAR